MGRRKKMFKTDENGTMYLYEYFSLMEKADEISRIVYCIFKKNDSSNYNYRRILDGFCNALGIFLSEENLSPQNTVITVMPSHESGKYAPKLYALATDLCAEFGFINGCTIISRTKDKEKSTYGDRSLDSHMTTMSLTEEMDISLNYIILDDITTTGNSMLAAQTLLTNAGVSRNQIFKIAVAKTCHV